MKVLDLLQQIELLYTEKHLPGEHNQLTHDPYKGGSDTITVGGAGEPKFPSKEDVVALSRKIRDLLPYFTTVTTDQMDADPDVKRILNEGQLIMPGNQKTYIKGKDGECHWNVARLYDSGQADSIMIGYARNSKSGNWIQHTWGMKDGKIVETTSSNKGNLYYYGMKLSDAEAKAFSEWTSKNPPGRGKVRGIPNKYQNPEYLAIWK